jgi:virginiamycin B lyase
LRASTVKSRPWIILALVALGAVTLPPASSAAIKTYDVGAGPGRIVTAPDGALWFTKDGGVGRITSSGATRSFVLPGAGAAKWVLGIALGPDGAAWATEAGGALARVGPDGKVAEFPVPMAAMPTGVVFGPDGFVWLSDSVTAHIDRFDLVNTFVETVLQSVQGAYGRRDPASPTELIVGPDDAVWFLELVPGRVGRVVTGQQPTFYGLPTGPLAAPTAIAAGPDGALWITEAGANRVARMATDGSIREYQIPSKGSEPRAIALGPDGAMWFTEYGTDGIGRIDSKGSIREYSLPTGAGPYGIAGGPDGGIWFSMQGTGQIGRLDPTTPPAARVAGAKRRSTASGLPRGLRGHKRRRSTAHRS